MFTDAFDFEAQSWKKGYFWTRADDLQCVRFRPENHPLLEDLTTNSPDHPYNVFLAKLSTERDGNEGEDEWNVIKPDENHSLYLEFSSIATSDRGAIIAFANRYGFLGETGTVLCKSPGLAATRNHSNAIHPIRENGKLTLYKLGESLHEVLFERLISWTDAITSLRHAVDVYQLLQQRNKKTLGSLLEWQGPQRKGCDKGCWRFASENSSRHGWDTVSDSTLTRDSSAESIAWVWLDKQIADGLAHTGGCVCFGMDHSVGCRVMRYIPGSLHSLMWFQFARAVAGNAPIRACKVCGKEYQLEPGDKQRKVFCGLSCKQKDYRDRKNKAKVMRSQGTGVKEIAAELDTELETIKEWVAEIPIPKKRK